MKKKNIAYLLTLIITAGCIGLYGCGKSQEDTSAVGDNANSAGSDQSTEATGEESPEIKLPMELDSGNLVLNSVFGSDIDNPDCNNEFGENIVSIEFINASANTLKEADFEVTLADGAVVPIHAEDIPSGATVWAFASDNASSKDLVCTDIQVTTEYAPGNLAEDSRFEISVKDTEVSVKNISADTLTGLTVYCHCDMGDSLFGGSAYAYPIESIAPNETVVINADDCFLGSARVASVE